jgi:hypothetical protein
MRTKRHGASDRVGNVAGVETPREGQRRLVDPPCLHEESLRVFERVFEALLDD